jgi:hypothetical protein
MVAAKFRRVGLLSQDAPARAAAISVPTFGRVGARQQAAGLGGGVCFLAQAVMALIAAAAGYGRK